MNTNQLVKEALKEDLKSIKKGDITTSSIIPLNKKIKAIIITKEDGVITGLDVAKRVFLEINKKIIFKKKIKEGSFVKKGKIIAEIEGSARAILSGERTALNFLQRLSGIATLTNKFVKAAKPARILDTRKTIPCFRALEKYAVKMGGGKNHRIGLYNMMIIKNNHIDTAGSIKKAVNLVRANKNARNKKIEVEARDLNEVKDAAEMLPDIIMLDNMNINEMKNAVKIIKQKSKKIKIEASGNMNLERVKATAKIGVDFISVGAITHSAKALDISLRIVKSQEKIEK